MKQVEELLDKYFEGETSIEEEKWLKEYFRTTFVLPPHLEQYRSLFGYFENERTITSSRTNLRSSMPSRRQMVWGIVAATAACIAYLIIPQVEQPNLPSLAPAPVVEVVRPKPNVSIEVKMKPTEQKNIGLAPQKNQIKKTETPKERKVPKQRSRKKDAFDPIKNVNQVEKSMRKLDVIQEMNSSLSPLTSLAYLEEYLQNKNSN